MPTPKRKPRRRPLGGTPEAYELRVHIDNEYPIYKAKQSMRGAITKKVCQGKFDAGKAAKGFRYVVDTAAVSYAGPLQARYAFPGKIRDEVARDLANALKDDVNRCLTSGDCGDAPPELRKCMTAKPLAGARTRRRKGRR